MIGILGGTFDPPHWGHLKLAQNFVQLLKLDQLILLPAGLPWQKSAHITTSEARLALTQAAALDLKDLLAKNFPEVKVDVSHIEIDREGPSYTIDTARTLRQIYGPKMPLVWLMGADSYKNLSTWEDWKQLPNYLHLAIANRPQNNANEHLDTPTLHAFKDRMTVNPDDLANSPCGKVLFDEKFHVDLSSTHIREALANKTGGRDLSNSIPPNVLKLINSLGIYQ